MTRYRRKPITVHALRLTPDGNIPQPAAAWVERAIADKRLRRGASNWFARPGTVHSAAAHGGDWLVLDDATGEVDVVGDTRFRALYELIDAGEKV